MGLKDGSPECSRKYSLPFPLTGMSFFKYDQRQPAGEITLRRVVTMQRPKLYAVRSGA
jgi:hypothetical protein